ncbi:MAG: lipoate--protein ligase family protein [Gemmatimonadetes bacterium]|nr:lipoate--protein ligase family protein [Gemmatimonadota bacterium]MYD25867.1 lipoate--protein ligase family protein [Gemmatimonadota bacterium]MYI98901.1 lipoate--protein ligase family protein [Gemmatimonadota bacterium]
MIRVLSTPGCSAAYNMAVDEALLDTCRLDAGGTDSETMALRIYSWCPPAVSIGYGQEAEKEIDPGQCERYGIDLVRRITGGRAVLHDQELTYSLVAPESHPALGGRSGVMLRAVSEALVETLKHFDIPAEPAMEGRCGSGGNNDVCFTATGRYEITVAGRKLAGSAQRRSRGVVLQHGSVLLGPGHRRLPLLMLAHEPERRETIARLLNHRTVSVAELIPDLPTFEEWTDRLSRSMLDRLNVEGKTDVLDAEERQAAESLVRTRYGNADWTYLRTASHVR